jgi:sugar lactone lactonase YvrE
MRKLNALSILCFAMVLALAAPVQGQNIIRTVAGGGPPDGVPALSANIAMPGQVAIDSAGNMYIASYAGHRVFRMDASGNLSTVAGTGARGFSGDGGPAKSASLNGPIGVALDSKGNLLITDAVNNRIRRIDSATGIITTVVGNGSTRAVDGVPAVNSGLRLVPPPALAPRPGTVFVDPGDNLFIPDTFNNRIRRVDAGTGVITTVAGNGQLGPYFQGDGRPATLVPLAYPAGVTVDKMGNLFISDAFNHRIRRVDAITRVILTIAGSSANEGPDEGGYSGDGGPAVVALLNWPNGVTVDSSGNLFIVDSQNARVRRVDATSGVITTVAGGGPYYTYSGDGGPATSANVAPMSVTVDRTGNLFIPDSRHRVRRVDSATSIITAVAGNGTCCFFGDGGQALGASMIPADAVADSSGNLYIADAVNSRVRRVDAVTGNITTVVGTGQGKYCGDYGPATSICLSNPVAVALDSKGNLFIDDQSNFTVRRVDAVTGLASPVIGSGGQPGALVDPEAIAIDAHDNLFIADAVRNWVIRVDATTGVSSVVAGNGQGGFSGDGGPATSASVGWPWGLTADSSGNLLISTQCRIRRVDAVTGIITTVAGNGQCGFGGDGGSAISASMSSGRLSIDNADNLFLVNASGTALLPSDPISFHIRRVDAATGIISTYAGNGNQVFSGDGGPATSASFVYPIGLHWSPLGAGSLFIADYGSNRVRVVRPGP